MRAKSLTEEQQEQIRKLYLQGYCNREIVAMVKVASHQVDHWLIVRKMPANNAWKRKKEIEKNKKDIPITKEMPPIYASPCKSITVDKNTIEEHLQQFGKRLEPIKMALSERQRTWNMNGVIFGSSFYTKRL